MNKLKLLVISCLIVLLSVFTFMKPAFKNVQPQNISLEISTSNKKNELSAGNEVRIKSVLINDSIEIPFEQFVLEDGWIVDNGILACYISDGAEYKLSSDIKNVKSIEIVFIGQKGSGNASIRLGDQYTLLDLYRDSDWEEVSWTSELTSDNNPLLRIDIILGLIFIVWFLLIVIHTYVSKHTQISKYNIKKTKA